MSSYEIEVPPAKAWWCLADLAQECLVMKLKHHRLKPGGVSLSLYGANHESTAWLLSRSRLFSTDAEFGGGKRLLIPVAFNPADNRVYAWCVLEKSNRRSKFAA